VNEVARFNVVSGFLNIVIADSYYIDFFNEVKADANSGLSRQTRQGGYDRIFLAQHQQAVAFGPRAQ
jgi:hypothetical protein